MIKLIKNKIHLIYRPGSALLVVLFIIMAITVLSLGFLARSSVELTCGENMVAKAEMDYLAESALEHAKGLILNPQDNITENFSISNTQLDSGSDNYYSVDVTKTGLCDFDIEALAFKDNLGEQTAKSELYAHLRINPFIAYYQKNKEDLYGRVTINGDAWFGDDVMVYGIINGDIYSLKNIYRYFSGTIQGQKFIYQGSPPVDPPGISYVNFCVYYYIGTTQYLVGQIPPGTYGERTLIPTEDNPYGIYYCDGDLEIIGDWSVNGTLVIRHDLIINNYGDMTITPIKNFPALIIGNNLHFEENYTSLIADGFVQVGDHIDLHGKYNAAVTVNGALFVLEDGIKNTYNGYVTINSSLFNSSLRIWPSSGNAMGWTPAAGAVYTSITRE